jgi:hypothetical protein
VGLTFLVTHVALEEIGFIEGVQQAGRRETAVTQVVCVMKHQRTQHDHDDVIGTVLSTLVVGIS